MPSAESPSDKIHSVAEVMPQRDSTEGISDSSLNEAPRKQWKVRNVYGQFKTAMSVTRKLRSQGIVARARQRADGNCVVEVRNGA